MRFKIQNSKFKTQVCDLCGEHHAQLVLQTPRLDGPLAHCLGCGLYAVVLPETASVISSSTNGKGSESHQVADEMQRLAQRAHELALVETRVEESEGHWRTLTATERLTDLQRFVSGGRLLEIGCSTGEMLLAARASFAVTGVEADTASSEVARTRGLECFSGTLTDAHFPAGHFDVATLYHVIEHLPSPRQTLNEVHRILRPNGLLVIETPNIATFWFRLLGAHWRQFIPDHRFFFTPETMRRLLADTGFEVLELRSVGKAMSLRLFISRLGRYYQPLARSLAALSHQFNLDDRTLRMNLGDVMRVYAKRRL